jgi:hypothetical protein
LAYSSTWRWKRHVSPKRRFTLNELHGVIFQKIESPLLMLLRISFAAKAQRFQWHVIWKRSTRGVQASKFPTGTLIPTASECEGQVINTLRRCL